MAIPTQPTSTSIVTEAYKRFGVSSPSSAQITRATDYGIEKVKQDLMDDCQTWKFLQKYYYIITKVGVSNYSVPSDYMKFIAARIVDGSRRGTAQGGSTAVCTLASADTGIEVDTMGRFILITGGAGVNQIAQIDDYNPSTKVVTFDAALTTAVDNTSTYMIVDRFDKLDEKTVFDLSELQQPHLTVKPTCVIHIPDDTQGKIYTNHNPDKVYGIELRYYADLMKLDLASALYTTLLRTLHKVLEQGVLVWLCEDDQRKREHMGEYLAMRQRLMARYSYGVDLTQAQMSSPEDE